MYVRGMVGSLRRRGLSKQAILNKMRLKSVDTDTAGEYLEECDSDFAGTEENGDFRAALIFARKKKIGPFAGAREEEFQKTLAKFARAGFSYDIANRVLTLDQSAAEDAIYGYK